MAQGNSFWFYIPMLAGGALPWIFLLLLGFGTEKMRLDNPLIRSLNLLVSFSFLIFSASSLEKALGILYFAMLSASSASFSLQRDC